MLHSKTKTELFNMSEINDDLDLLRYEASKKLLPYHQHKAGGGSLYVHIGDIKIRFSNHENISSKYSEPDYNIIKRKLYKEEIENIINKLEYPSLCKQKAFSLHVGKTIPYLKKLLPIECFEKVVENEYYFNTFTTFIKVKESLEFISSLGILERNPVKQETFSLEDYCGENY